MKELSDKHRRFADLVFGGQAAGRAYETIYTARGRDADCCAAKLQATAKVRDYMASLREKAVKASQFTTKTKLDMLFRVATSQEDNDPRVTIAAIAEENRMTGGHAAEKVEVNATIEVVIGA